MNNLNQISINKIEKSNENLEKETLSDKIFSITQFLEEDEIIEEKQQDLLYISEKQNKTFGISSEFKFLRKIRDENKLNPGNEGYDSSTLYISESEMKRMSKFERQYWEIKKKNFDTILFFKKGNFYELYELDAQIGHDLFDLKLTMSRRSKMAGVPASSLDFWISKFVAYGFKVGKVEQTETDIDRKMNNKNKNQNIFNQPVLERELTQKFTIGTLVDENLIPTSNSTYLLSVKEAINPTNFGIQIGVCFVDTSTSTIYITEFEDDIYHSKFETLLFQIKPGEFLLEKTKSNQQIVKIIKKIIDFPLINFLTPEKQFWTAEKAIDDFQEKKNTRFFKQNPECLEKAAQKSQFLLLSCFGACIYYLNSLELEDDIVSLGNIQYYDMMETNKFLVMDAQVIVNLELFQNTNDRSEEGTLFQILNHCCSNIGSRLLRQWITRPLVDIKEINRRLDIVDDIAKISPNILDLLRKKISKLPDLERSISRIHSGKSNLEQFLSAINGFKLLVEIFDEFEKISAQMDLVHLQKLVSKNSSFPDLKNEIDQIEDCFDHQETKKQKKLIPKQDSLDPKTIEYNRVLEKLSKHKAKLQMFLKEQREFFGCEEIVFKDIGANRFQLEIPKDVVENIGIPDDFYIVSQTKIKSRYWNPYIRKMCQKILEDENVHEKISTSFHLDLMKKFDVFYLKWKESVKYLGELDCLISFCVVSSLWDDGSCRPILCNPKDYKNQEFLEVRNLIHPCIKPRISTFIPNDIILGSKDEEKKPNTLIITGPNMAGKSTLLRQACIAVILSQIGCYVPAESCFLTPVDRIFTRIGANDNIMYGESTFMVELKETSIILKNSTQKSLVILDELGRGTSTEDGFSIAYSVLKYFSQEKSCRLLFSTHHHSLCDEFSLFPNVGNFYMSYSSLNDSKNIVLLYKLVEGSCPVSFGINVAKMAGIPESIICKAEKISEKLSPTENDEKENHEKENKNQILQKTLFKKENQFFLKIINFVIESENNIDSSNLIQIIPIFSQLVLFYSELNKNQK
ncbi:DNA mismatch repair protein msh6 [Anaeramoeba ignava]|uniref:DNA mismatch repair protein msh6 n=1 Tax=Anaeramoeba ignava TaxID=1746090 RepID=A0A9Q0LJA8_ANAIG|nr:DNA mismatch repair protein msh6 [Anaeramoeba ignava]